ncbi:MAG: AI-2E family transporter [Candidatus Daviesbacteria bacterium]|nr:AI-2E family transporter [Candidatus Daviesbacteria bacterium]
MSQRIDISYKTIVFIAVFILGLILLYLIRDLLLILFASIILMSALHPLVKLLTKKRLPKILVITVIYVVILTILIGMIASIFPTLIEQTNRLIVTLPGLVGKIFNIANIDRSLVSSELADLSKNLFSLTLAAFDNLITFIFLLVLTFYLLLEHDNLEQRLATLFVHREERAKELIVEIEEKLGSWLRGQLFLSLIIGLLAYIGLTLLNIPYSLPLAIIAGFLEVIPVIGPIIAALPAIIVALTISPVSSLGVAAMYFIIQQFENHLIVPQVMNRAVGLNPLVVILAIAIGSRLLGIAGALLAVPIAVVLQIVVTEVIETKKS